MDTCNKEGRLLVNLEIVEAILPKSYEWLSHHFSWLMAQLTDFEKILLLALANAGRAGNKSLIIRNISKLLDNSSISQIKIALHNLERRELLSVDKQGNYSFTMELFRRWLVEQSISQEMKDYSRVAEEGSTREERSEANMSDHEQNPTSTNTTHIGHLAGPVHTGSGDINIDALSYSNTISTKDEFLSALRAFKVELEVAHQQGLPEETYDDTIVEVEAAEREAKKDTSKPDRIIDRLEKAKAALTAGTGAVTATAALIEASNKLAPLLEAAIHAISKIF